MKSYVVTLEYMFGSNSGQYFQSVEGVSASEAIQNAMNHLRDEKAGVHSINLLNVERV